MQVNSIVCGCADKYFAGNEGNFAPGAVPIELAADFGDATTVAVIQVVQAATRREMAFRIPSVGVDDFAEFADAVRLIPIVSPP